MQQFIIERAEPNELSRTLGIYAFLLGAGTAKVARILRCSNTVAKGAVESFIENTKGLGKLRNGLIKRDAARGYFEGLDGRKVINNSEYLMLAGYLQNGEAVILKYAAILWNQWAKEEGLGYRFCNFVHDEYQTEVFSYEEAVRMGELQCKAIEQAGIDLGVRCPLSGETKIGKNWYDTH